MRRRRIPIFFEKEFGVLKNILFLQNQKHNRIPVVYM